MTAPVAAETCNANDSEYTTGVRLLVLNLPDDEGEGLGFRLTRTLWDPYPWVREVTADSRADAAGLKTGDCLLQADGKDLLGLPVSQVAGLIRGDGAGRGLSLLVWNCGVDPKDDPELLWSCGGGARGERARRALAGAVRALACGVCGGTARGGRACARSHLYCAGCWSRLERCALCRETLPPTDSPYARNLVAEQVFEAIATEYEIKDVKKRSTETSSAYTSPNRSPNMSPSVQRRGQYQLSLMNRKKHVQFNDKYKQTYASDPNIHRSSQETKLLPPKPTISVQSSQPGNSRYTCQNRLVEKTHSCVGSNLVEKPNASNIEACNSQKGTRVCSNLAENSHTNNNEACSSHKINCVCSNIVEMPHASNTESCSCQKIMTDRNWQTQNVAIPEINVEGEKMNVQNRLVARLRQACSLADLQSNVIQSCQLSRSLNNLGDQCKMHGQHGSLDNLKSQNTMCDQPVFLLSAPPIYVVTCDHSKKE